MSISKIPFEICLHLWVCTIHKFFNLSLIHIFPLFCGFLICIFEINRPPVINITPKYKNVRSARISICISSTAGKINAADVTGKPV